MIYLIKRTDPIGWDEYDSVIVRSDSPEQAHSIAKEQLGESPVTIEVVDPNGVSELIHSSFNAG